MKILLITKTLENKGGVGRHSNEILKEFKKRDLISGVIRESGDNKFANDSFFIKPISNSNFFKNILNVRRVAKQYDIIHAMDVWPYGVYGYFAVLGTKKKLFINGIGSYSVAPFRSFLKGFLLRRAYKRANRVFCISEYTKKRILEHVELDNVSTNLYGTVELPSLSMDKMSEYKDKYNLNDNYPILLTVGDIKHRKGQLNTLMAVSYLKEQFPNFKYVIVGDNGDRGYVSQIDNFANENNLSENVLIVPKMYNDEELSFFYQICDVFIMNSNNDGDHFEGFGGVFLEAAQFGKPVIGSRDCGIESAIKDNYNGYLTKQKDSSHIYNKILLALENKDRLSKNSGEWYKQFSWEKTVLGYIKYYENIIN